MTTYIIITLCILTLLSYFFDVSGKKTKIPGVILLLALGIFIRLSADFFSIFIPNLKPLLPVLGTIGLILIVLEGSLDLELRREKIPLIRDTILSALVLLVVTTTAFSFTFYYIFAATALQSVVNAIPLGIISSAIAISSTYSLEPDKKEFVVYESSFSDITGILVFNFFALNSDIGLSSISGFLLQILLIVFIAVAASGALGALLQRITHHVKSIPIITILILLYSFAKIFHLPSLVLILVFGLFLNNVNLLDIFLMKNKRLYGVLHPESIRKEIDSFKHLVGEVTFVVRSFFFIMFGYYTNMNELLDLKNAILSLSMIAFIMITRAIYFRLAKLPFDPVVFIAPRGLITILLFLSIPDVDKIAGINEGFLSQIIFMSSFIMMFGLLNHHRETE